MARPGYMVAKSLGTATNAPIQGSSADIIKVAMVQLQDGLQRQGLAAQLPLKMDVDGSRSRNRMAWK